MQSAEDTFSLGTTITKSKVSVGLIECEALYEKERKKMGTASGLARRES